MNKKYPLNGGERKDKQTLNGKWHGAEPVIYDVCMYTETLVIKMDIFGRYFELLFAKKKRLISGHLFWGTCNLNILVISLKQARRCILTRRMP